jgi:hypothetical protein
MSYGSERRSCCPVGNLWLLRAFRLPSSSLRDILERAHGLQSVRLWTLRTWCLRLVAGEKQDVLLARVLAHPLALGVGPHRGTLRPSWQQVGRAGTRNGRSAGSRTRLCVLPCAGLAGHTPPLRRGRPTDSKEPRRGRSSCYCQNSLGHQQSAVLELHERGRVPTVKHFGQYASPAA